MPEPLRVGIAGFGAIGQAVAAAFAMEGGIPGLRLTAIGARDAAKVRAILPPGLLVPPDIAEITDLAAHADIVIECAPAALLCAIAEPVLQAGHTMVVLSCGALLGAMHLGALSQTDFMQAAVGADRDLWSDEVAVFNPGTPMDSRSGIEVMTGPRDLPRARREIGAAGYKSEPAVLLGAVDLPLENAYATLAADVLRQLGMTVDLPSIDWGTTVQRRAGKQPTSAGGWSAFFTNLTWTNNFDPASHLGLRSGSAAWFGWPTMPRIEALRAQWFETSDPAAQKAICAEIERQFWIDVPYVPLGAVARPTAYSANLTTPRSGILQAYDVARRT